MSAPPTISQVLESIGRRAPWQKAASWDPVGLQLGDPADRVERLALCHEVTEAVLEVIEAEPVDLLVSYHPLLFQPMTRLLAGPTAAGRALRLLRAGAGLAIVHTNFDVAPGGTADSLAETLGLEGVDGFGPLEGAASIKIVTFLPADAADAVLDAVVGVGAGIIGSYTHCSYRGEGEGTFQAGEATHPVVGVPGQLNREPEKRLEFVAPRERESAVLRALVRAHPYEEPAFDVYDRRGDAGFVGRVGRIAPGQTLASFAEVVAEALGDSPVRVAGDASAAVERIAVVPGSGGDFLSAALEAGADVVVTGDVGHHAAREALDRGLALIDPGHTATERPGLAQLFALLAASGADCRSLLALDPNPWWGAG